MRLILFVVFLIVNLIGAKKCNAQTGTFIWTNGAPTTNPGASGARFAVDRATFRWYEWVSGTTWIGSGDRIQQISGCSAPNYTPGIHNSFVVVNSCTNPEIYIWNGASWAMPPSGGGITSVSNGLQSSGSAAKLGGELTENTTISKTSNQTLSLNVDTKQAGQRVIGATSIKTIEYPVSTLQMATSAANGAIVIKLNQASTNYIDLKLHINTSATKIVVNPVTSNSFLNMDVEFGALLTPASSNLSAKWSYSQNYPELEFALTNKLMVRLAKEASGNYVFIVGDITDTWGGAFNASGNFNALIERINLLDIFGYNIDGAKPTMAFETSLSAYTILATENANPYNVFTTANRPVTQERGYQYFDTDKQVLMVFNGIQYEPFGDATPILSPTNTAIKFDRLREYGSVLSPISGNLTVDFNVNNMVRSQLIFHKSASVPTFPANSIVDGVYFTDESAINVIDAEYRGINQIFFKINK